MSPKLDKHRQLFSSQHRSSWSLIAEYGLRLYKFCEISKLVYFTVNVDERFEPGVAAVVIDK